MENGLNVKHYVFWSVLLGLASLQFPLVQKFERHWDYIAGGFYQKIFNIFHNFYKSFWTYKSLMFVIPVIGANLESEIKIMLQYLISRF